MPFEDLIAQAAERYGIPYNLLYSQIEAESSFNPMAVSSEGAQGLMQLMPATAQELGVTDPFDPAQSIDAGARYLAQQYHRFGSWPLALAAYNFGPANVASGRALPPETQAYVNRIMAALGSPPGPTQPPPTPAPRAASKG